MQLSLFIVCLQVESLPSNAVHIARSEHCEYEMIVVHNSKTGQWKAFSHQGHVELPRSVCVLLGVVLWCCDLNAVFVCRKWLKDIYQSRREKIDSSRPGLTDDAIRSLAAENKSDELLVVQWDVNFLRRTYG